MRGDRELGGRALRFLVPLLITSAICNQQLESVVLSAIGQVASTTGIVLAGYVVLLSFRQSMWAPLVIVVTVLLKLARLMFPGSEGLVLGYELTTALLWCAAGAIAAVRCPRVIARQVTTACILGVPLMVLQLMGVGEWTQFMRTDWHDGGLGLTAQFPTFLLPAGEVVLTTVQARPAGFFSSNNLLSMVLMCGIGLHFGQRDRRRLGWRDVGLGLAIVLVMSKGAFLVLLVVSLWLLVVGNWGKRLYVLKMAIVVTGLVALYARLFPGVFAFVASFDAAALNFYLRWYDLLFATGIPELADQARVGMLDLSSKLELDDPARPNESGYAMLAATAGYLLAAVALLAPFFWWGCRWLRRNARARLQPVKVMLLTVLVVPVISSFLASVFFWFVAGFALTPLFVAFEPRHRLLIRQADSAV